MGTLATGTTDSLPAVPGELSWVQLSRQSRYRRQVKNLMETLIPGTAGQPQASYWYANYNVTSNSQSNSCKMAPSVNKDLCRGNRLILFSFIFKWWTRKKRSSWSTKKFDWLYPKFCMHIIFYKKYKTNCSDEHTEIENQWTLTQVKYM